ncbi:hypothetical protein [Novosphingobium sp. ERN07]|uniref:hypothetical protein n=1 Tax=Novosphingobium sp. ERN07 TaxID=2726187 RepID=UPI00197DEC4F|nr:hypothetical protein [Novosphingobium sp. ERN07]
MKPGKPERPVVKPSFGGVLGTQAALGERSHQRENRSSKVGCSGVSAEFALPKCASIGYTEIIMKDAGFRIRVQKELREQFVAACKAQDKPAAQVLREFMRDYVEGHPTRPQLDEQKGKK